MMFTNLMILSILLFMFTTLAGTSSSSSCQHGECFNENKNRVTRDVHEEVPVQRRATKIRFRIPSSVVKFMKKYKESLAPHPEVPADQIQSLSGDSLIGSTDPDFDYTQYDYQLPLGKDGLQGNGFEGNGYQQALAGCTQTAPHAGCDEHPNVFIVV